MSCARDKMFADFYSKSHNWPMLLWNAYKDDGDDPAHGLSDLMFDNLRARVHCDFEIEGAALQKCLDYIGTKPFGPSERVVLTCHKENATALHVYRKLDFGPTGEEAEDEVEMLLRR